MVLGRAHLNSNNFFWEVANNILDVLDVVCLLREGYEGLTLAQLCMTRIVV